jgi:hypothetical protein
MKGQGNLPFFHCRPRMRLMLQHRRIKRPMRLQ